MLRDFLNSLKDKKIHIVGLSGTEGAAVASFLIKHNIEKNVEASDFNSKNNLKESFFKFHSTLSKKERDKLLNSILNSKIKIHYKDKYLKNVEKADIIFASQGWIKHKQNYPRLSNIFKKNKEKFFSMTKLYLEMSEAKTIGVTGSNGKSTTVRLIYEMCKRGDKKTFFAGNDRANIQVLDKLENMKPSDLFVLEISDRQLIMPIKKSPHIAVITNIVPNHLDDHGTFARYIKIKKRILDYQTKNDSAVLNYDNRITKRLSKDVQGKVYYFSTKNNLKRGAFIDNNSIVLNISGKKETIPISYIKIPGKHNIENILAASLAASLAGISSFNIKKAIEKFHGLKQRLEYVSTKKGRKFFYDRQGTTSDATIAALKAFDNNIIHIVGGEDKGMEYERLAKIIAEKVKYLIILPGTGSKKIKKELKKLNFRNYSEAKDIREAISAVAKDSEVGDTILLSPSCVYAQLEFVGKNKLSFYDLVRNLNLNNKK